MLNHLQNITHKFLLPLVLVSLISSCAFPKRSLTRVNISGQLLGASGAPLKNEKLELTLPAGYGLNDIDRDFVEDEEVFLPRESIIVETDAIGSFSHSFKPVPYSAAYWVLPPVGSVPKSPPFPYLYIRVLSDPKIVYSVLIKDDEVVYSAYDDMRPPTDNQILRPPLRMEGQLIEDERGELFNWTADLKLISSKGTRAKMRKNTNKTGTSK